MGGRGGVGLPRGAVLAGAERGGAHRGEQPRALPGAAQLPERVRVGAAGDVVQAGGERPVAEPDERAEGLRAAARRGVLLRKQAVRPQLHPRGARQVDRAARTLPRAAVAVDALDLPQIGARVRNAHDGCRPRTVGESGGAD